jgi:two-component system chemotaxis response regulator CheB
VSTTRQTKDGHPFEVVVVVGSLGALASVQVVLGTLPAGFPAAVVVDLHRAQRSSTLEELLRRRCGLAVTTAREGQRLEPGTVYVAPHDRQLVITGEQVFGVLGQGEGPGHRFADELLISAAAAYGPGAIAVVLSGRLDGGARGVREVSRQTGRVLVQNPDSAPAAGMPNAALATGCVDFALDAQSLGHALVALCAAPGGAELFRVRLNSSVTG